MKVMRLIEKNVNNSKIDEYVIIQNRISILESIDKKIKYNTKYSLLWAVFLYKSILEYTELL